eukprot:g2287.t1
MVLGVVQAINKFAPKEAVGDDEEKDEEVTALFDESDEELLKKICVALSRSFSILMSLESSAHERRAAEENFIHEIEDIVANCAGGGDVEFHFKSPKYRYVSPATKIREPGYEIDGQLDWKRLHRHGVVVVNPDSKISWTVAKLLRAKAGLIDAPSLNDQTPLMLAAIHGNVNVIRNLLTSGANPYLSDRGGDTALHYAAKAKQIGALKLLLGAGCDPLRLNGNALSAFQICLTKVAFKDNILFRICMTSQKDSKGQSLAFEYDWPTAQFIINGKISKGRRKQNDPNTSGGCLINDPNESNKIIAVYPFNEFAAPTVLQALDWSCGERLSINADEFSMPQNYTEWIEASCVGNTLSKGKDRVRYNPFTHEFQFDFQLNRRKRSTHHHILPDTKYDVTLTLLYDKKAVNSVTAQGISFSSCHICSGVTDKIIYQPGDFGTRVRYWPPINHGDGEKKARHPQSLKVNVLNGHVREHQREIEERKKALNKCKEGRRLTRSASSADHKVQFDAATVYEKRLWGLLKLHDKITQSPSNAALFMGDWYGSIEMRQMSFSRKRLRYMAKTFGGIWPEALLTMIITIYLQEDDVLVFQSITLAIRTLEDKLIHSKQVCYPEVFENGGTPELQDQKAIGNPVDGHNSDGKDRENKLDREEDGGCVVN